MSTFAQILYHIVFATKDRQRVLRSAGYGAFTHCFQEKDAIIKYIKSQEKHHRVRTFKEELAELLKQAGVPYEERYLE
jgi:hypothetical protein